MFLFSVLKYFSKDLEISIYKQESSDLTPEVIFFLWYQQDNIDLFGDKFKPSICSL